LHPGSANQNSTFQTFLGFKQTSNTTIQNQRKISKFLCLDLTADPQVCKLVGFKLYKADPSNILIKFEERLMQGKLKKVAVLNWASAVPFSRRTAMTHHHRNLCIWHKNTYYVKPILTKQCKKMQHYQVNIGDTFTWGFVYILVVPLQPMPKSCI
jgi:hypothetical protein